MSGPDAGLLARQYSLDDKQGAYQGGSQHAAHAPIITGSTHAPTELPDEKGAKPARAGGKGKRLTHFYSSAKAAASPAEPGQDGLKAKVPSARADSADENLLLRAAFDADAAAAKAALEQSLSLQKSAHLAQHGSPGDDLALGGAAVNQPLPTTAAPRAPRKPAPPAPRFDAAEDDDPSSPPIARRLDFDDIDVAATMAVDGGEEDAPCAYGKPEVVLSAGGASAAAAASGGSSALPADATGVAVKVEAAAGAAVAAAVTPASLASPGLPTGCDEAEQEEGETALQAQQRSASKRAHQQPGKRKAVNRRLEFASSSAAEETSSSDSEYGGECRPSKRAAAAPRGRVVASAGGAPAEPPRRTPRASAGRPSRAALAAEANRQIGAASTPRGMQELFALALDAAFVKDRKKRTWCGPCLKRDAIAQAAARRAAADAAAGTDGSATACCNAAAAAQEACASCKRRRELDDALRVYVEGCLCTYLGFGQQ